jgi:urease accessory protein
VQRVRASVAGALDLGLEPTVVAARAHHRAELTAELSEGAVLTASERVLLGRAGEDPGRWTGTTRVVRSGRPLLHTTVGLGPGEPAWLPPVAPRAYASTVHLAGDDTDVLTADDAVRLPLPGGWVTTAWGTELHSVVRAAEELTPGAQTRVIA